MSPAALIRVQTPHFTLSPSPPVRECLPLLSLSRDDELPAVFEPGLVSTRVHHHSRHLEESLAVDGEGDLDPGSLKRRWGNVHHLKLTDEIIPWGVGVVSLV